MSKQKPNNTILNAWIKMYNPLRGLTKPQIDLLFDQVKRGNDVRLQVAFYEMERTMPIYGVVLNKRLSGVMNRKWTIETIVDTPQAEIQRKKIQKMFEYSDTLNETGLTDTIRHLALASFRGRACVKAFIDNNDKLYFRKLENWNVLDYNNKLYWNPTGDSFFTGDTTTLTEIPKEEICCVKEERPIDIPGILIYLRQLVGEEGWARALERYGVAQVILTAQEGVPDTNLDYWKQKAIQIFEGGSGVVPYGTQVHFATEARGQDPFSLFCQHQMEVIALLALGGSLSTVGGSTGLGSNLADVQNDQFNSLVTYDCKRISNAITNSVVSKICKDVLKEEQLVRFTFIEQDETTPKEYLEMAQQLLNMGIKIDVQQLKKLTNLSIIDTTDVEWSPSREVKVEEKNEWTPPGGE